MLLIIEANRNLIFMYNILRRWLFMCSKTYNVINTDVCIQTIILMGIKQDIIVILDELIYYMR